ncbi:homoserine O-acetyltransferase [Tilletiaria anomala UBC 951]|uniref:Homoserine O-acetyltransferase n=1 Tax=Tilletiaria anomala (strain ATCC 24038 / CBS 436.72 / UBC 951) TaxID=1037660 RepID=A0A066WDL0_TILAU|nr:homoserine O-acetyltransferase [Tilletiaria anomala UBC 951]KDN52027.1 homoserine O-acetyltransferase [Tilletiaria anomala UBC 951]
MQADRPWSLAVDSAANTESHILERPFLIPGPTSPQSSLLASGQSYLLLPRVRLDNGTVLHNAVLAYKTWGTLDPINKNNALVVCHALTGSADVEDWWGPLIGPDKLFDPTRFFVVCGNVLGSPYGSSSPCTLKGGEPGSEQERIFKGLQDWDGEGWWGPEFPSTSVRDDVRIQKALLDFLGVEQIAAVIGGSMGGMAVLEWPLCFPTRFPPLRNSDSGPSTPAKAYIKAIVPLATSANHSAWGISWAEAQRQSIYSDPAFVHGYYRPDEPPRNGLAAARMAALLTYRSRESFESRFGRRIGGKKGGAAVAQASVSNGTKAELERRGSRAAVEHNEGNTSAFPPSQSHPRTNGHGEQKGVSNITKAEEALHLNGPQHDSSSSSEFRPTGTTPPASPPAADAANWSTSGGTKASLSTATEPSIGSTKIFSAQSYLRYQGDKFVKRFDANCYIHLTRKMDQHDVARGREKWGFEEGAEEKEWAGLPLGVPPCADPPAGESGKEGEEYVEAVAGRVLGTLSVPSRGRFGAPPPRVQVVSIESDGLFAPPEQQLIHDSIKGSELVHIASPDGHDGFLLEFEQINRHVGRFLRQVLVDEATGQSLYDGHGIGYEQWKDWHGSDLSQTAPIGGSTSQGSSAKVKESVFGEVEDVTRW